MASQQILTAYKLSCLIEFAMDCHILSTSADLALKHGFLQKHFSTLYKFKLNKMEGQMAYLLIQEVQGNSNLKR